MVDHDGVRAANGELAVTRRIPDQADARLEIAAVLGDLAESGSDPQQRHGRRIELDELVVGLGWRRQEVVAQAEIQLHIRSERDGVLHEAADRVHVRIERSIAQRDPERAAESLLKRRHTRIGEVSGISVGAVVLDAAELAAELDDVVAAQVRRGVSRRECRHDPAARETRRSAEVQSRPRNRDLWQRDRHAGLSNVDPHSGGVDQRQRIETDVDPVEADPNFVHQSRAEDVRLVDGHHLAMRAALVAVSGHGVALRVRLLSEIPLKCVIPMEFVVLPQIVPEIHRVLIDIDRRERRPDDTRTGGVVRLRDVLQQSLRQRIGDGRPLRWGQRSGVEVDGLQMAKAFITEEEERPISHNRSAEVDAELLAVEHRLGRRRRVEIVARVVFVVAVEVERFAVHRVAAGPCRDVDDRSRVPAVLGAERRVVDLELGDGVDRRLEGDLRVRQVVEVDAVDHEVDRRFTVARRHERKRALTAQRRAQPCVLRRRRAAGHQRTEVDEVTAVERNLLHGALRHRLSDRDRCGVDERRAAADRDIFRERGDAEPQIQFHRLRRTEIDFARLILKPFDVRHDRVVTRLQRRRDVLAGRVGHRRAFDASRLIANGDRNAGHDCALCVGDRALKRGR